MTAAVVVVGGVELDVQAIVYVVVGGVVGDGVMYVPTTWSPPYLTLMEATLSFLKKSTGILVGS